MALGHKTGAKCDFGGGSVGALGGGRSPRKGEAKRELP